MTICTSHADVQAALEAYLPTIGYTYCGEITPTGGSLGGVIYKYHVWQGPNRQEIVHCSDNRAGETERYVHYIYINRVYMGAYGFEMWDPGPGSFEFNLATIGSTLTIYCGEQAGAAWQTSATYKSGGTLRVESEPTGASVNISL